MSLKKSVLTAVLVLTSALPSIALADQIGWGSPFPGNGDSRSGDNNDPWGDHRGDRDREEDRRGEDRRYEQVVEESVRRYFDRYASLDLLLDSYTRNQLLGRRIRDVRILMASDSGRGAAQVLANSRSLDSSVFVSRDLREYTFRLDGFSNEVGRSLRSLSLEMQGRFYVERVVFDIDEDRGPSMPFPMPSQTEVLRQQINQTFDREGGLNLFRQFPLLERQGQVVRRVTVVAMSRGYMGTISLLENNESFGQSQAVGVQPVRLTFELRGGERIGRELQSLRLQMNGMITVLEVSVEVEGAGRMDGGFDPRMPMPRDPREYERGHGRR